MKCDVCAAGASYFLTVEHLCVALSQQWLYLVPGDEVLKSVVKVDEELIQHNGKKSIRQTGERKYVNFSAFGIFM